VSGPRRAHAPVVRGLAEVHRLPPPRHILIGVREDETSTDLSRSRLVQAVAGHPKHPANLVQRLGLTVGESKAHSDDSGLPLRQRVHDLAEFFLQQREAHRIRGNNGLRVLDRVAELAVAILAKRGMQRDGLAAPDGGTPA